MAKIEVSEEVLTKIQEDIARLEKENVEKEAKIAGLEEMVQEGAQANGQEKIKEKRSFEPTFRTVRLRKFPIAGDVEKMGYVIGWTKRGAFHEVDKSGISPQLVDYIELIFLGNERGSSGKLQAEKVRLLDFLNKGIQVHCKILEAKKEDKKIETGEQVSINIFDPQHGLVSTGEMVDSFVTKSEIKYKIQIPGVADPIWIDSEFCNA